MRRDDDEHDDGDGGGVGEYRLREYSRAVRARFGRPRARCGGILRVGGAVVLRSRLCRIRKMDYMESTVPLRSDIGWRLLGEYEDGRETSILNAAMVALPGSRARKLPKCHFRHGRVNDMENHRLLSNTARTRRRFGGPRAGMDQRRIKAGDTVHCLGNGPSTAEYGIVNLQFSRTAGRWVALLGGLSDDARGMPAYAGSLWKVLF